MISDISKWFWPHYEWGLNTLYLNPYHRHLFIWKKNSWKHRDGSWKQCQKMSFINRKIILQNPKVLINRYFFSLNRLNSHFRHMKFLIISQIIYKQTFYWLFFQCYQDTCSRMMVGFIYTFWCSLSSTSSILNYKRL